MSNIQKWGSFDIDQAAEEKEELASMGGGMFLKIAAGRNVWRFMPPLVGRRSPFVKAFQHYIDVPGQPSGVSFNCPRVMDKRFCQACSEADKLRASGNAADYDAAQKMGAKLRVFANVIARANPEMGPQIVAFGKTIYESLLGLREDAVTGGDFTDPEQGFDIVITKTGEKMTTKYGVTPARDTSPLGNLAWIEQQHDLTRFGVVPSDEEIAGKLAGCAFGGGVGALRRGAGPAPARAMGRPGPARAAPAATGVGGPTARGRRTAEDDALNGTED